MKKRTQKEKFHPTLNEAEHEKNRKTRPRKRKDRTAWIILAVVVFEASALSLLALRDHGLDSAALALAIALPVLLTVQITLLSRFFPYMDRLLFIIVHFLCGIGVIVLFRLGTDKGLKHFLAYGLGCFAQIIALVSIAKFKGWWKLRYVIMGASLTLLLAAVTLGKEKYGATNWINFGGFSMQPSEFVKAAVPMVLALYLSRSRELRRFLPAGGFIIACALILVIQRDLGAVLIYFSVAVFVYYTATGDLAVTLTGLAAAAGGAVLSYRLFSHVRIRVAIWQNPWATIDSSGYQIVQSLMAIGSGGLFGMGLGQGLPRSIPVYDSDFIFAVLCEEFGVVMGLCVLALYMLLILRSAWLAMRSRNAFASLLAFGVTVTFAIQTFLIVGGVINMIPLTGVTLPFISNGGSSMITCLALIGIMTGLSASQGEEEADLWRAAKGREQLLENRP